MCAQAILFFAAGFESISSTISFLLYELAVNPDVQERLYQEIRDNEVKNNGKFDYTSIQNMIYMDMVVSGMGTKLNFLFVLPKTLILRKLNITVSSMTF